MDTEQIRKAASSRLTRWVATLVLVAGWAWLLLPSGLGGPLSLVWVRGDSMQPTYQGGDLVVAYRWSAYDVGDIVAFEIPEGGIVIHRIVDVTDTGMVPQGDNRAHIDPWVLTEQDIVGRAMVRIPAGGRALHVLRQPAVLAALAFAAALMAAWPSPRREEPATAGGP